MANKFDFIEARDQLDGGEIDDKKRIRYFDRAVRAGAGLVELQGSSADALTTALEMIEDRDRKIARLERKIEELKRQRATHNERQQAHRMSPVVDMASIMTRDQEEDVCWEQHARGDVA